MSKMNWTRVQQESRIQSEAWRLAKLARKPRQRHERGSRIRAKWAGTCAECGYAVEAGTLAYYDGQGQLRHLAIECKMRRLEAERANAGAVAVA